jgi:Uma2 family endonuclease
MPLEEFEVRSNAGHVRLDGDRYAVPDVAVVPVFMADEWMTQPNALEEYGDPLPFVAEVWSRSTGDYDVDRKLPAYRARGDLEIWRIHPYERSVIAWRRSADGTYSESRHERGVVPIASLPGVAIDLDRLFARLDR